ncbi:cytochrome protein [Pseudomassariella vexata]|uniref:Cytochrome protein n=1 Tax=Pseudomassariella vexata TaxID=1141098 RepID=A0A1Y2EGJ6_9PEZI|nr:cytochrome protein [Pseudomassariella vexata]ORY70424.1 cytochrome protein [Pseudomassariella vexata]
MLDLDSPSVQFVGLVSIVGGLIVWAYTLLTNPLAKLPGPWYSIWTDTVLRYHILKGQRPTYVHSLHLKYGPIIRIGPTEASIQDLSSVKQIYRVKGEFLKSVFYQKFSPDRHNIFNTLDVNFHRRWRRLLSAPISETGLVAHQPVIEGKIRLAVQRMVEEMEKRGAADVFHWFMCMTTDIIGELSFGESFHMLETGSKTQYIRDLEQIAFASSIRATIPWIYKLAQWMPFRTPVLTDIAEQAKRTMSYAGQAIKQHYDLVDKQGEDAKPTLFSKLYKAGEDGLNFAEIRDNAASYIIAGSDTTTNTLTYLVWSVCKHPHVQRRLVDELSGLSDDDLEDQKLKNLPYLNQVIQESMRLYPAAPSGLPRAVPREGAEMGGYFIPGGHTVSVQAYSMHRDAAVYPEPLVFDPSRWEEPTQAMKDSFVPFGGGSRICLGLHLARIELRLATARFFRTFPNAKMSNLEGFSDEDMKPAMFFLLTPKTRRCLVEAS